MKRFVKLAVLLFLVSITPLSLAQQFVPVLMYHHVRENSFVVSPTDINEIVTTHQFFEQMLYLKQEGYTTITMQELTEHMNGKRTLPAHTIAITVDDGWKSALTAAEIMKTLGFKATFFIVSGFLHDSRYLNESELIQISSNRNFEIGAHSVTHFLRWINDQSNIDPYVAVGEMLISKVILEKITNRQIKSFAWPFGAVPKPADDFLTDVGFTSAVLASSSTQNVSGGSPLSISRLNVSGACSFEEFKTMLATGKQEPCTPKK